MKTTPGDELLDSLVESALFDKAGSGQNPTDTSWSTVRGAVRSRNEDRLAVIRTQCGARVAIVADGIGGMDSGDVAAATAVASVVAHFVSAPEFNNPGIIAQEALQYANDVVHRRLRGQGGAAVVVAVIKNQRCFVVHAGDARAYFIDLNDRLRQLTTDDTLKGQRGAHGVPSAPHSRFESHLLQFVGQGPDFVVHLTEAPIDGRCILLTTDGVHCLPQAVLQWVVSGAKHLRELSERLTEASLWHGGEDNATVAAMTLRPRSAPERMIRDPQVWFPSGSVVLVRPRSSPARQTVELTKNLDSKGEVKEQSKRTKRKGRKKKATDVEQRQLPEMDVPPEPSGGSSREPSEQGQDVDNLDNGNPGKGGEDK